MMFIPRYAAFDIKIGTRFARMPVFLKVAVVVEWVEMDSNHRRHKPADLQSAPFGHSGIHPNANAKLKNKS